MRYAPAVETRFRSPRWVGDPVPAAREVRGRATTPASDAVLELGLVVAGGRIEKARFRAYGCPATIAAADWACEWLEGRTLEAVDGLSAGLVEQALALAPDKRFCGLLVEDALGNALEFDFTES